MSVRAETRVQPVPLAVPVVHSKLIKAQTRLAWILLTPSLLVVALVALVPLAQTFAQSFTNARLASARPVSFVGLQNYINLVQDGDFLHSIWVTVQFTVITVAIEFLLGLKPMTHFDAGARPMTAAFQGTPDPAPYTAEKPRISLEEP